jgi:hypothetical protein
MPEVITGKDGAISIAGGAVNGKVTNWKATYTSKNIDNDGAGDAVVTRTHLRKDWTITGEFYNPDQTDWELGQDLVGTAVVLALKRKSSDTNPYITTTGLIEEFTVDHGASANSTSTFTAKCNGTDLTFDTSPAS